MAYAPEVDAHVTLRDGRRLAYCEWGDRDGRPVLLCHGAPGSRAFGPDPGTTAEAGVRLITADRPGYGRSDPLPDRRIVDWPADVEELTAALGVDTFDVVAHSSGGPYALACAHRLSERVHRVALVSCVAPAHPSGSEQGVDGSTRPARRDVRQAAGEVARSAAWLVDRPEGFLDLPRPEADRRLLTDPGTRAMFAATIREAVVQGVEAYGWECAVERLPWGFALEEISPPVWIYQGEQDRSVSASQARALAAALPGSTLRVFPDEGHGLILARWAEILGDLRGQHGRRDGLGDDSGTHRA